MKITPVEIVKANSSDDRLLAFASIVFDREFVVKEIRIIYLGDGGYLVAMPSRKVTYRCTICHSKYYFDDDYCSGCGNKILHSFSPESREVLKHYVDMCHPITAKARKKIELCVFAAFRRFCKTGWSSGTFRMSEGEIASATEGILYKNDLVH